MSHDYNEEKELELKKEAEFEKNHSEVKEYVDEFHSNYFNEDQDMLYNIAGELFGIRKEIKKLTEILAEILNNNLKK